MDGNEKLKNTELNQNRARALKRSSESVSPEVQEEFMDFCRKQREYLSKFKAPSPPEEKIIPDKLLQIEQYKGGNTSRNYFSQTVHDNKSDFEMSSAVSFFDDNTVELQWLGEGIAITIDRNSTKELNFFYLDDRDRNSMTVHYSENGEIDKLIFGIISPIDGEPDLSISLNIEQDGLEALNNKGEIEYARADGNLYRLSVNGEQITLRRSQQGKLKDEIIIPTKIKGDDIINGFINPITLEDPINADPDLDNSWRFANVWEMMSINWNRL